MANLRRTRVLHIIQNLNYGGMERLLADIVRRLDRARFESHVLVLGYLGRFSEGLEEFATLHVASPQPRWSLLWPSTLAADIARIAPDVVHTHSGVWYKASRAARMAGVRNIVHTDHGRPRPDVWQSRLVDGLASRNTTAAVAVSERLRDELTGIVRYPDRLSVIANGVDTTLHRPRPDDGALRQELGIPAEAPIIGSVGRLQPVKGYDVMLAAFAQLLARSGHATRPHWGRATPPALVLVGDGAERARLQATALAAGVASSVHFLGWRDDISSAHSAFTLFTMSSRSEGTSLSLLEAMSAGLCPVVTDVGGNAAVLGPALAHRLVPSENPAALAGAWEDALRDPAGLARDAVAARARVESAFGIDSTVRSYEAVYERAVMSSAPARDRPSTADAE